MADGSRAHEEHGHALALATELHASGDTARALEVLPGLVAARPDDIEVRLLLARCLSTAGVPAVALAAADAAVACDPTSWEAHALLAQAALAIDPDRAATAADRAVQLAPHEPAAVRAQIAVRDALKVASASAAGEKPARRPGGFGAALGLRPSPAPRATPAESPWLEPLDEPRVEPRLPAALDPARTASPIAPAGTPSVPAPRPPNAPAPVGPAIVEAPTSSLPETAPDPGPPAVEATPTLFDPTPLTVAPPPSVTPPTTGAIGPERVAAVLPASLGGTGLAGATLTGDDTATGEDGPGPGPLRLAFRVVGLAFWLWIGFRYGVQVIGGPIGFAVLAVAVAGVVYGARQVKKV